MHYTDEQLEGAFAVSEQAHRPAPTEQCVSFEQAYGLGEDGTGGGLAKRVWQVLGASLGPYSYCEPGDGEYGAV